jgi:hypothetical protein
MTRRLCLLAVLPVIASLPVYARQQTRTSLAPGVELVQTMLTAAESGGPLLVHAIVVDPKAPGVTMEAALGGGTVEEAGGGREVVQRMVARTGAIAGVNAAFFSFDAGDPLGLHIHQGEIVSEPWPGRPAFGFRADGSAVMGSPQFSATLQTGSLEPVAVSGVNRRCGANELVVYAPIYGSRREDTPVTAALVRVSDQRIRAGATVKGSVAGAVADMQTIAPPANHIIVAGKGTAAQWLKASLEPGREVTLSFSLTENGKDWSTVVEAVSGMPSLLSGGAPTGDTSGGESFARTRHPRTAVGVTADGRRLLVVVDGRQVLSRGASLPELTAIMKDLGAVEAMNLDGGGSSTLSVRGLVLNSPSDGASRQVSDGLVVKAPARRQGGAIRKEDLYGPLAVVSGGAPLNLPSLWKPRPKEPMIWGTVNGGAWVSQQGLAYGFSRGTAGVRGLSDADGLEVAAAVHVLAGPVARLRTAWKNGLLEVTAVDANGNGVPASKVSMTRADGATAEVVTDTSGKAVSPAGWLESDTSAVNIAAGSVAASWPPATPGTEKK